MSQGFYTWSQTASSNASASSAINWAEGQAPSSVNDSARAMMAETAKYRDDIAGAIVTGGTSTAYTVTSYQVFDTLAHLDGKVIAFTPHATSTNAVGVDVTLSVDSLGAKPIRMQPSVALPTGTLILGTPYIGLYNNSDGVIYLHNTVNPYVIPLAAGMDFWGSTTPNSSFAFPTGQAISRTTYATLFSIMGTTYGTGNGSTTFNLPDKTGRISAMQEASATRLTSTYFGGDSTALGAVGGSESHALTTAELASHSHTATDAGHTHTYSGHTNTASQGSGASFTYLDTIPGALSTNSGTGTASITVANTGSGSAHTNVQPTIVCNYILRIAIVLLTLHASVDIFTGWTL
jgi:microcystin-dependent protein